MRSVVGFFAVAFIAAAVPTVIVPTTVQAAPATWGVGAGLVSGGELFAATEAPGAVVAQRMRVSNGTGEDREIKLYAGPSWRENGVLVDDGVGTSNALTRWTTLSADRVFLRAGEETEIDITVTVPADAPSTRLHAVVWADAGAGRAGVRLDLTVAGENGPAPEFTVTDLVPTRRAGGDFSVGVAVAGTGALPAQMNARLRLLDGPGAAYVPDTVGQATTLPGGAAATVPVVMDRGAGLGSGPWTARGYVDNGYMRIRIDRSVTFPDRPGPDTGTGDTGSLGSLGSLATGS